MTLAYFRPHPDDLTVRELVIAIDGKVTRVSWSRARCILAVRALLPFIEAPE